MIREREGAGKSDLAAFACVFLLLHGFLDALTLVLSGRGRMGYHLVLRFYDGRDGFVAGVFYCVWMSSDRADGVRNLGYDGEGRMDGLL